MSEFAYRPIFHTEPHVMQVIKHGRPVNGRQVVTFNVGKHEVTELVTIDQLFQTPREARVKLVAWLGEVLPHMVKCFQEFAVESIEDTRNLRVNADSVPL